MKVMKIIYLACFLVFVAGCAGNANTLLPTSGAAQNLPTPIVHVTEPVLASPETILKDYLNFWAKDEYASMYQLISKDAQKTISSDNFVAKYRDSMNALTLKEFTFQIPSADNSKNPPSLNFHVVFKTNLFGDFPRDLTANFVRDDAGWRIVWDQGMILPELKDGSYLQADYDVPARGMILDRNGKPFVTQTDVVALGVIPSQINPKTENALLGELSRLTGMYPGMIMALYDDKRNTDWYVPVGEAIAADAKRLAGLAGAVMTQYTSRFYYENGIAPQTIGYVSPVTKEQLDQYVRAGYSPAARVGQAGIEKWGEPFLSGTTGETLYIVSKDGVVLTTLGKTEAKKASSISLTLDEKMQIGAQDALSGFNGSIVVMERDTGRILAMASSPKFDPNLFDPNNANSGYALGNILNDPQSPLLDRSIQGQYPLGSVFKVMTFSAALESGTYTPDTMYHCGYDFSELPDRVLHDWTWEHYQNELAATGEGKTRPSGDLTLVQGLMRSCNPYFWHIGLDLYDQGRVSAIANMARGFGLGSKTGIGVLDEASGTIVNPTTPLDAVNQAIGQGDVLVTPLQVADFMAAIGNGGTLFRPQIVEDVTDSNGNDTTIFKPESRGVLPMKPETLSTLRTAMLAVIRNPRGTAYNRFLNLTTVPIYGKTGTAQTTGNSHAWFAGYTDANNPDLGDISIAVIAENGGEGSEIAAPMFKRMVEIYFFGKALSPYPWETSIGVTRTPTSPVTPTPSETPTP